jgi:hypothetical protein
MQTVLPNYHLLTKPTGAAVSTFFSVEGKSLSDARRSADDRSVARDLH